MYRAKDEHIAGINDNCPGECAIVNLLTIHHSQNYAVYYG